MKISSRMGAAGALLLSLTTAAMAGPNLAVGSPAPPMKVAKWVKGTPITSFAKGKVYVVEFWATWCGPCKQSIPHLTELAKKYAGKATFTGVSVWETNAPVGEFANYGEKVSSFVNEWGDKMNYNVAWDGDEATMAKTWMQAAGQNGIPASFVVDRTGKIAWIGHPMDGLDEAVGKVIAGTFDVKAEAAKQAKIQEAQMAEMAERSSYIKPLRAGDFKGGVAAIDKLIASKPNQEFALGITRYIALSNYDPTAANAYAKKLANGPFKKEAPMLNSLAWSMVDEKGAAKGVDFNVAQEIAEKCVALTKSSDPEAAFNLDTLACAYNRNGQLDKALATEQKAIAAADATKNFDAATRKEIAGRLQEFEQKKSAGKTGK